MSRPSTVSIAEKPLHSILVHRLPGIKPELMNIEDKRCAFKMAVFFAAYTKKQIKAGNDGELKKCFHVADDIVRLSSTDSKQAIENVYVFALLRYIEADAHVKSLLPSHLSRLYKAMLTSQKK